MSKNASTAAAKILDSGFERATKNHVRRMERIIGIRKPTKTHVGWRGGHTEAQLIDSDLLAPARELATGAPGVKAVLHIRVYAKPTDILTELGRISRYLRNVRSL